MHRHQWKPYFIIQESDRCVGTTAHRSEKYSILIIAFFSPFLSHHLYHLLHEHCQKGRPSMEVVIHYIWAYDSYVRNSIRYFLIYASCHTTLHIKGLNAWLSLAMTFAISFCCFRPYVWAAKLFVFERISFWCGRDGKSRRQLINDPRVLGLKASAPPPNSFPYLQIRLFTSKLAHIFCITLKISCILTLRSGTFSISRLIFTSHPQFCKTYIWC